MALVPTRLRWVPDKRQLVYSLSKLNNLMDKGQMAINSPVPG